MCCNLASSLVQLWGVTKLSTLPGQNCQDKNSKFYFGLTNNSPIHCMPKNHIWFSYFCQIGSVMTHFACFSQLSISICAMLMGIALFGYTIASTTASMANADAQRARYQEKMKAIKAFLKVGEKVFFLKIVISRKNEISMLQMCLNIHSPSNSLKEPSPIFPIFSATFGDFGITRKLIFFLINHVKFHGRNVLRLEDLY